MRTHRHLSRGIGAVFVAAVGVLAAVAPAAAATHRLRSRSCRTWTSTGGRVQLGTSRPAARPLIGIPSLRVRDRRGHDSSSLGSKSRGQIQIPVRKTFTCDDDSGEIFHQDPGPPRSQFPDRDVQLGGPWED